MEAFVTTVKYYLRHWGARICLHPFELTGRQYRLILWDIILFAGLGFVAGTIRELWITEPALSISEWWRSRVFSFVFDFCLAPLYAPTKALFFKKEERIQLTFKQLLFSVVYFVLFWGVVYAINLYYFAHITDTVVFLGHIKIFVIWGIIAAVAYELYRKGMYKRLGILPKK
ncbi:MAG: hypothetical protein MUD00_00335 [Candidatus Pacebacteria bacterium]|jgi:hypothetical protein|nr:hypothetical protein [Candidatus Paceibacterota bacterium]